MSKEIKIGLAIVGALGLTLGAVLSMRLRAKEHPAAVEAQEAKQALAALKEERARMDGEPTKPSLFGLGDSGTPATDPAASDAAGGQRRQGPRHDPFHHDANPLASDPAGNSPLGADPASIVGDRYATPAATTPEERREERREERKEERAAAAAAADPLAAQAAVVQQEMRAADPFQQAGQGAMNNPMAGNPSAFGPPPQATLADGIAPAGDPQSPSPYGPPPGAEPLTRSAGDVRLDPNPDGGNPDRHHHEKRPGEMLQTAGEAPVGTPGDPRYGDYRGNQNGSPYQAADVARERAVMKEMRRDEDRYRQRQDPATTASAPQYDIYGRDIRNQRDDPPPGSGAPLVPDAPAERLTDDPLGRRTDNLARDGTDAVPTDGKYRVAPGDNFWTISQKVYGNGSYFKALEEHNREQFPYSDKLPVGQVVRVPPARELEEQYPDLTPRPRVPAGERGAMNVSTREPGHRTYKVQEGDTLFDIARDQLGRAARWNEIYELNRAQLGNDFNFLSPGMELLLPENRAPRDPLTTQARQPQTR